MTTKVASVLVAASAVLFFSAPAHAGSYFVYACSSFGNTAPAFSSWTDSNHFSTANECMQPAPNGGDRSLEINNPANGSAPVYQGRTAHWIANAPAGISIVGAYSPPYAVLVDCSLQSDGFSAQYFWGGGGKSIGFLSQFGCNSQGYGYGTGVNDSFGPSSYFGWGVTCSYLSTCSTSSSAGAVLGVQGIRLTAEENSGPGIIADGTNNLWYQWGHYVRGGGWPVGFTAMDPSGVCGTDLLVNGGFTQIDNTSDTNPDTSSFTQCWPSPTVVGTLDTTAFPNGPLTLVMAAINAAGVGSTPTQTVQLDNTPVRLSLSTPDDSDPNVWVNHAVHVAATASAGPSGVSGTKCSSNDGPSYPYPAGGIALDGTGIWTVSCSSWNASFDTSGTPATSPTETVAVHIDQTPPSVSFESVNPGDPQAIVVDTSDAQSGVASGQIELRPAAGGSWQSLGTELDGAQLRARLDDTALPPGRWTVQATSCDHAGNCGSAQETLNLPLRIGSTTTVGLAQIRQSNSDCSRHSARGHRRRRRGCDRRQLILTSQERVRFGHIAHLRGQLTTVRGTPISGVKITILTAPEDNGLTAYAATASATTGSDGTWTATLAPGPSRTIEAIYAGSSTIQPSQAWARLIVPARVRVLRVWPRHVPWGGKVHIQAQLVGGYLPPEGALVRLRLGYGNARITYGVQEHVGGNGIFEVTNSFGPGPPSLLLHYWLQECTLPEGDYPYAPACGPRDRVIVGRR